MQEIRIKTKTIQVDQLLKLANLVSSGGEAKLLIKAGKVIVNGEIELRRAHKLVAGDQLRIVGEKEIFRVINV